MHFEYIFPFLISRLSMQWFKIFILVLLKNVHFFSSLLSFFRHCSTVTALHCKLNAVHSFHFCRVCVVVWFFFRCCFHSSSIFICNAYLYMCVFSVSIVYCWFIYMFLLYVTFKNQKLNAFFRLFHFEIECEAKSMIVNFCILLFCFFRLRLIIRFVC